MNKRGHGGDIYEYSDEKKGVIIDFSVNINPLGITYGINKAFNESISMIHNYPDPNQRRLKQCISKHENVPKEWIVCGNGAADIIFRLVYAKKPKKSLLLAPTFSEYEEALKSIGSEIIYYNLKESNEYELQEDILDMIDETLDTIWICNPNNPTGKLITNKMLQDILNKFEQNGVLLVVDECFNDFLDEPKKYSLKNRLKSKNLFILKAFTKMYAIPGVRLGYGISSGTIVEKIENTGQTWSVSTIAQYIGCQAVKEEKYVEDTRKLIQN